MNQQILTANYNQKLRKPGKNSKKGKTCRQWDFKVQFEQNQDHKREKASDIWNLLKNLVNHLLSNRKLVHFHELSNGNLYAMKHGYKLDIILQLSSYLTSVCQILIYRLVELFETGGV